MIKLIETTIHKYKSFEEDQSFLIDENVTVLVGMNESGKTAILEALAKSHYFEDDNDFKFNTTHDYPRKEKKQMEKSGVTPRAITRKYLVSSKFFDQIKEDVGSKTIKEREFSLTNHYGKDTKTWSMFEVSINHFIESKTDEIGFNSDTVKNKIKKIKNQEGLKKLIEEYKDETYKEKLEMLKEYYNNDWNWDNPISEYIARKWLSPNIPKFLYYDEYYSLSSRISIEKLNNKQLDSDQEKTAKALFELAEINTDELIKSTDFEDYKAELEATEAIISGELFKFWSTNTNLEIEFEIDKIEKPINNGTRIVEHILDIRVKNKRARVSLPLKNRSKGFIWFFSFLVWFKKIQEDKSNNYILLLDEPGLNLHAAAQADLLKFIESLTDKYQVIYTTHSPFMIDPSYLHRVRTVLETEKGSKISDSIQEKDPDTLFPLQAALGYDIAQNLFISKNNLLVEGVSDLIYLQTFSSYLEEHGKVGLNDNITIVPVGGLDKVATFVSLLRGSKLNLVCLLDSSIDTRNKTKLENLSRQKIIKERNIIFFDEFINDKNEGDIEDLFSDEEYLNIYNASFSDSIKKDQLDNNLTRIIAKIEKGRGKQKFNHYRPANYLLTKGIEKMSISDTTIDRFEEIFKRINGLFK